MTQLVFSGYYCIPDNTVPGDVSTVITLCPPGFFCPNGTHYDWQPCPAGTYSDQPGLREALECTPCDAGHYCQGKFSKSLLPNAYTCNMTSLVVISNQESTTRRRPTCVGLDTTA